MWQADNEQNAKTSLITDSCWPPTSDSCLRDIKVKHKAHAKLAFHEEVSHRIDLGQSQFSPATLTERWTFQPLLLRSDLLPSPLFFFFQINSSSLLFFPHHALSQHNYQSQSPWWLPASSTEVKTKDQKAQRTLRGEKKRDAEWVAEGEKARAATENEQKSGIQSPPRDPLVIVYPLFMCCGSSFHVASVYCRVRSSTHKNSVRQDCMKCN